jgi:hypothetical protein
VNNLQNLKIQTNRLKRVIANSYMFQSITFSVIYVRV